MVMMKTQGLRHNHFTIFSRRDNVVVDVLDMPPTAVETTREVVKASRGNACAASKIVVVGD